MLEAFGRDLGAAACGDTRCGGVGCTCIMLGWLDWLEVQGFYGCHGRAIRWSVESVIRESVRRTTLHALAFRKR